MEPDKGKLKEGIAFISKKKDGYLRGVLHRDDIGDIDLPWGVAHNDHTGKGMAHIIRKHIDKYGDFANVDEAAEIISDVVENGKLREDGNNTVAIEKDNYRVVVVKDNEGNWILSAFDFVTPKKEKLKRKDAAALDTPGQPVEEAGAVTPNLSAAKVAKADETAKDSGVKVAENGEAKPTEGERVVGSAVLEIAKESTDVVADKAEMQRVLNEGDPVLAEKISSLEKASQTIKSWIEKESSNATFEFELPKVINELIRKRTGVSIGKHVIAYNGIRHGLKNHGVDGKKLTEKSIPVRNEDAELIPYIMVAPDRVEKGSSDITGRDSVKFIKALSNGVIVVVEKENKVNPNDMETINIWAEMSSSNVANAHAKHNPGATSETVTISTEDAAKIRKDAENAIAKDNYLQKCSKIFRRF